MNAQYDNERRGALFKNLRKRDGKQDPDYQGSATIGGIEYWVSSWINTNKKDGSKYMSLVFKPKDEQAQQQPTDPPKQAQLVGGGNGDFDDDIPFSLFIAPLAGLLMGAAHVAQAMF